MTVTSSERLGTGGEGQVLSCAADRGHQMADLGSRWQVAASPYRPGGRLGGVGVEKQPGGMSLSSGSDLKCSRCFGEQDTGPQPDLGAVITLALAQLHLR